MIDCSCDYDPPEFWSKTVPTARKQHRCEECAGPIFPGEKYEYIAGKWGGYFDSFKTCERCVDIRQWVQNNLPCFCWAHGNMIEDAAEAVNEASFRTPTETVGLRFGFLRRKVLRDKRNQAVRAAA